MMMDSPAGRSINTILPSWAAAACRFDRQAWCNAEGLWRDAALAGKT
jgi:hypothetical protein